MQISVSVDFDPQNPGAAASAIRLFAKKVEEMGSAKEAPAEKAQTEEPKKRGRKPAAEKEQDYSFGAQDEDEESCDDEMFGELKEKEKEVKGKKGKPAKKLTADDVAKELFTFVKANGRPAAVKILSGYGAKSPADLEETDYASFVEELKNYEG
jgi:hypothetical protein